MCGIAGIYSIKGKPIFNSRSRMRRMLEIQHNRGPDQSGFDLSDDKRLIIGCTRLSIVDVHAELPLPFQKKGSKDMLSFNGEIFNYKYLRNLLCQKNIIFKTQSDTEVLFEAIKYYKEKVFKMLSGMWGFAYFNDNEKTLTLSRDLLGERHIFYLIKNDELIFASDPKAIIAVSENYSINFDHIPSIWMYNTAPPEETLVKNIKKVLPGQNIKIKGEIIKKSFHRKLEPQLWKEFFDKNPSTKKVNEVFNEIFTRTINERIPEEVKFVTTLSGGIDSSVCNYYLSKRNKDFTAIFGKFSSADKKYNNEFCEGEAASFTSKKLNIKLKKFDPFSFNLTKMLNEAAADCFDGCVDDGVVPFSVLARITKSLKSKVILISDGPDEFLGGYSIDKQLHKIDKTYLRNNTFLQFGKLLSKYTFTANLLSYFFNKNQLPSEDIFYKPFRSPVNHQLHKKNFMLNLFDRDKLHNLYSHFGTLPTYYKDTKITDFGSKRALIYATKSTPDMFNLRADKAFMKHSIEVRLPFQDPKLVEFFIALPTWFRFKDNDSGKFFLREIVKSKIGREVSSRSKFGFADHLWNNNDIYESLQIKDRLRDSDFFKHDIFKNNVLDFIFHKNTHRGISWSAYALMMTYERLMSRNI